MKKITITIVALMTLTAVSAQNNQNTQNVQPAKTLQQSDTLQFMNAYRQFTAFVMAQPSLTKPLADSLMARQDTLMSQYRTIKPQLTDHQVEEYNMLKGRYNRKMLAYRGDRLGEGLEATGDSIAKATGRVGSAIGGFFKGLFKK